MSRGYGCCSSSQEPPACRTRALQRCVGATGSADSASRSGARSPLCPGRCVPIMFDVFCDWIIASLFCNRRSHLFQGSHLLQSAGSSSLSVLHYALRETPHRRGGDQHFRLRVKTTNLYIMYDDVWTAPPFLSFSPLCLFINDAVACITHPRTDPMKRIHRVCNMKQSLLELSGLHVCCRAATQLDRSQSRCIYTSALVIHSIMRGAWTIASISTTEFVFTYFLLTYLLVLLQYTSILSLQNLPLLKLVVLLSWDRLHGELYRTADSFFS